MKSKSGFVAALLLTASVTPSSAATLFSDDFNAAGSSANYLAAQSGQNLATFAYDYSERGIPAPNIGQSDTLGLKLESNMTAGAVAAITLHSVQQFTGAYKVSFDAWMNAVGPFPGGGAGSTEFFTAGVGGNGTTVNYGGSGPTGVGGWTAVDAEGGSGVDYRLYKSGTLQAPSSGQYAAGTVDSPTASNSRNADNAYYAQFGNVNVGALPVQGANNAPNPGSFTEQTGTTQVGAFGFEWHRVELVVDPTGGTNDAASMTWLIDGLKIGTLDAGVTTAFSASGSVTLGYYDPFSGVAANAAVSFAVVDNLAVTEIPEPATAILGGCALLALIGARRRCA
jgi:hypothetical protein